MVRTYPVIHEWIVSALFVYQACTMSYLIARKKFYYALLLAPLLVASIVFARVCRKTFHKHFHCAAAETAAAAVGRDGDEVPDR